MYQVPLCFVQVGPGVAICATRVVTLMATGSYQARQTIKRQRKNASLVNAAGRLPVKTAVFLDNGVVIASPYSVNVLLNKITKATFDQRGIKKTRKTKKLQYHDVQDFVIAPEEHEQYEGELNQSSQQFIID